MQKSFYELSGFGYYSKINLFNGADIEALKYNGKDILVPFGTGVAQNNFFLHGSPLLLPANRTVNGIFNFESKEYRLPVNDIAANCHLHGFLYRQNFVPISFSENELVAEFINDGSGFPFTFSIRVIYSIGEKGFSGTYTITNLSGGNMPLVFGLHTTFCEPDSFSVPISQCQERYENCVPTGKYVLLNEQQKGFKNGTFSKGNNVYGYYKSGGNKAIIGDFEYAVSDEFTHWILYNGSGNGGFLCVEPQCGEVNGLNGNCKILPPNGKVELNTLVSKRR